MKSAQLSKPVPSNFEAFFHGDFTTSRILHLRPLRLFVILGFRQLEGQIRRFENQQSNGDGSGEGIYVPFCVGGYSAGERQRLRSKVGPERWPIFDQTMSSDR